MQYSAFMSQLNSAIHIMAAVFFEISYFRLNPVFMNILYSKINA